MRQLKIALRKIFDLTKYILIIGRSRANAQRHSNASKEKKLLDNQCYMDERPELRGTI